VREGSERTPDLREDEKRAAAAKLTFSSCLLSSPWRCACSYPPPYLLAAGDAAAAGACCAREMESERCGVGGRVFAFQVWSGYIREGSVELGLLGKNWAGWAGIL
jgi:hypothetical protein